MFVVVCVIQVLKTFFGDTAEKAFLVQTEGKVFPTCCVRALEDELYVISAADYSVGVA